MTAITPLLIGLQQGIMEREINKSKHSWGSIFILIPPYFYFSFWWMEGAEKIEKTWLGRDTSEGYRDILEGKQTE
jgi:hypothetical protein